LYYTLDEARSVGRRSASFDTLGARGVLRKEAARPGRFDVFLSHSFRDQELVLGIKRILERSGQSVYVDWIDDPLLDRLHVTAMTADQLRRRMQTCNSLIYAASPAAQNSKWMPWELGYFDGKKGAEGVAVMKLPRFAGDHVGQEYLDLYPQIEHLGRAPGTPGYRVPQVTIRRNGRVMAKSIESLSAARTDYRFA
jgi:hypothetical protein